MPSFKLSLTLHKNKASESYILFCNINVTHDFIKFIPPYLNYFAIVLVSLCDFYCYDHFY
ncbi:hypothetical protein BVAVS116_D0004 (plasmid) [Borreliella valaisiana VS116]|uniref:Uncharacterized protein n=1 Tax=Borreliella valaisiana VS116 TaxID=445987 RepID=C0R8V9_BORVA|nr:hypothetical protein BVAVS116_D0004 [Borreliella valaisiana VS116]